MDFFDWLIFYVFVGLKVAFWKGCKNALFVVVNIEPMHVGVFR